MVSDVEPIIESMVQPGMMQSVLRRVEAMVAAGVDEPVLAERERDVRAALATGLSRRDAAEQMHLSVNTIKTYAQHAYRALGVSTLPEAVEGCHELGVPLGRPDSAAG